MKLNYIIVTFILYLITPLSMAKNIDKEGSKDHPLVSRYPDSYIKTYVVKDFDEYVLPLSAPTDKKNDIYQYEKSLSLEGKITRIGYQVKSATSTLKVYRNFYNAFKQAGFNEIFSCQKETCGNGVKWRSFFIRTKTAGKTNSQRMMILHKNTRGQDVHILLYVGESPNHITIGLDVIESKAMQNGLVEIDVSSLQKTLETEGKISLYGIKFEVNKANLLDKSKKEIEILADVLRENSSMRIYIVGHTDDNGQPEHNIGLSKRRAQSVAQQLINKYKINKNRLSAFGAGPYAPVSNNANKEGRALNRRVEIVKRL